MLGGVGGSHPGARRNGRSGIGRFEYAADKVFHVAAEHVVLAVIHIPDHGATLNNLGTRQTGETVLVYQITDGLVHQAGTFVRARDEGRLDISTGDKFAVFQRFDFDYTVCTDLTSVTAFFDPRLGFAGRHDRSDPDTNARTLGTFRTQFVG